MNLSLIIPAFIAGLLTFLAPCTLPLVPGYLGFISGASPADLQDPKKRGTIRRSIFLNGLLYVVGFTVVFMIFGTVFGAAGAWLSEYRILFTRIGGGFVIFFGLYLMHVFNLSFFNFLNREKRFRLGAGLTPGKPLSSFLFGATFAFGWTPCVGPVLGSILILASSSGQVLSGAFLLFIFSLGLALPFLLVALLFGHAAQYIQKLSKYLHAISIVGGAFLVFLGILLVSDNFAIWVSYFYQWFEFIRYEQLLEYL